VGSTLHPGTRAKNRDRAPRLREILVEYREDLFAGDRAHSLLQSERLAPIPPNRLRRDQLERKPLRGGESSHLRGLHSGPDPFHLVVRWWDTSEPLELVVDDILDLFGRMRAEVSPGS